MLGMKVTHCFQAKVPTEMCLQMTSEIYTIDNGIIYLKSRKRSFIDFCSEINKVTYLMSIWSHI